MREFVAALGKGDAVQESLMVLRLVSGRKAMTSSNREIIYPTEYMPVFHRDFTSGNPPVATAFETRDAGDRLEIEAVAGPSGTANLRTMASHVTHLGNAKYGQGASEAEMPLFSAQRINTGATLKVGLAFLLGKTSPQVLAGEVTKSEERIWFSFATVGMAQK